MTRLAVLSYGLDLNGKSRNALEGETDEYVYTKMLKCVQAFKRVIHQRTTTSGEQSNWRLYDIREWSGEYAYLRNIMDEILQA